MLKILKADIYRIKKEKNLLWPTVIVILLGALVGYISDDASWVQAVGDLDFMESLFLVPVMLHSFYFVWVQDFRSRTVNNSIAAGISRSTYYNSKVTMSVLISVYYFLVLWLTLFFVLFYRFGPVADFWQLLKLTLARIPFYVALSMLFSLTFIVMKKEHVATILTLLWLFLGESVLSVIINEIGLGWLENYYIYSNLNMVFSAEFWQNGYMVSAYLACIIYTVLAYVIGLIYFKKKELN